MAEVPKFIKDNPSKYYRSPDGTIKERGGGVVFDPSKGSAGSAPTVNTETPSGDISQPSQTAKYLPQFTTALQQAMDEAGKHRQANLIGISLSGVAGGKALGPNTVPGIVDMVRRSVGPEVSAVFGGATAAVSAQIKAEQEERNFQLRLREQNINLLSSLAEDGVLMDMPNSALIGLAKSAGLSTDTALAWKARLAEADKRSEEDRALEYEKIRAEIEETKANTAKLRRPPSSGKGGGGGSTFLDITAKAAADALAEGDFQQYRLILEQVSDGDKEEFSKLVKTYQTTGEAEGKSEYFDDLELRYQNLQGSETDKRETLAQEILNDPNLTTENKREALNRLDQITKKQEDKGSPPSLTELDKTQKTKEGRDYIFNVLYGDQTLSQG